MILLRYLHQSSSHTRNASSLLQSISRTTDLSTCNAQIFGNERGASRVRARLHKSVHTCVPLLHLLVRYTRMHHTCIIPATFHTWCTEALVLLMMFHKVSLLLPKAIKVTWLYLPLPCICRFTVSCRLRVYCLLAIFCGAHCSPGRAYWGLCGPRPAPLLFCYSVLLEETGGFKRCVTGCTPTEVTLKVTTGCPRPACELASSNTLYPESLTQTFLLPLCSCVMYTSSTSILTCVLNAPAWHK